MSKVDSNDNFSLIAIQKPQQRIIASVKKELLPPTITMLLILGESADYPEMFFPIGGFFTELLSNIDYDFVEL